MLGYFDILLFGLLIVAIRVNAEDDIKGLFDFLKTIETDGSATYPVISIGKLITPDNVEIYEAEISSPQESENENSKPQNSFGDEINMDSMLPASDLVKDVNKKYLHRQIQPMDMHYHRHGSGWWPGFNQGFHSKWRPGGRDGPSHYNYGYHHRPHGHHNHNGHNNQGYWSNQDYLPNYWNSYHNHNSPNSYNNRPSYYERPSNNHENFYHNHPYQPSFHNNHNNEHPNYSDYRPPYYNERPSKNNDSNNPLQPLFNNSNDDYMHQQTENPITNYHDEDSINPITNTPPPSPSPSPQPQTEVSPHNNENLDQLYTEIFGVPTTTEEVFLIDQRMKDDSADALVYDENTSQVSPVTPEA